jgi:hypothetical protein
MNAEKLREYLNRQRATVDKYGTGNEWLVVFEALIDISERLDRLEAGTPAEEAQGSGYTHGWDKGFAQKGDPYGIESEYLPQSANPDASVPTQKEADAIKSKPN